VLVICPQWVGVSESEADRQGRGNPEIKVRVTFRVTSSEPCSARGLRILKKRPKSQGYLRVTAESLGSKGV